MKLAGRLEAMGSPIYKGHTVKTKVGFVWNGKVSESNWGQMVKPLSWKKPRRIFVNSMSDLFHDGIPDETIDRVFAVMALCPQHTFQVLTKRPARMRYYLGKRNGMGNSEICRAINAIPAQLGNRHGALEMPLPNVWLGVSVEDQARADERIPLLLDTPAAKRFLSCEPLLGPVDLTRLNPGGIQALNALHGASVDPGYSEWCAIDWVIVGGESGKDARPMHPDWVRSLRDQCKTAGVSYFFKQWGAWHSDALLFTDMQGQCPPANMKVGKKASGRILDGMEHNGFPA
jgi:protein gp37